MSFESLFISPEDILCPGSDEEETSEEYRDKRRRVESLAMQYLNGRGLFIMSASLRGPLEEGWVNPWADRKSYGRTRVKAATQVAETAKRTVQDSAQHEHSKLGSSMADHNSPLLNSPTKRPKMLKTPHAMQAGNSKDLIGFNDHAHITPRSIEEVGPISHDQCDFRNWNSEELAQAKEKPQNHPRGWLKSDNALLSKQPRRKSKSPTPSPAPRTLEPDRNVVPEKTYDIGFTPVNKHPRTLELDDHLINSKLISFNSKTNDIELEPKHLSKISVHGADLPETGKLTRQNHYAAKPIYKESLDQVIKHEKPFEAVKSEKEDAPSIDQISPTPTTRQSVIKAHGQPPAKNPIERNTVRKKPKPRKPFLQALPPSTYLPEFEYRFAAKPAMSSSTERLSLTGSPEAIKKNPEPKFVKTVSFDKSLANKEPVSQISSPEKPVSSLFPRRKSSSDEMLSQENIGGASKNLTNISSSENPPAEYDAQPEAQMISAEPVGLAPSGLSTNLLETDKLQSLEEGDSYALLSTQAAIFKAQQSFQNDLVSKLQWQSLTKKVDSLPELKKTTQSISTPRTDLPKRHTNEAKIPTPSSDDEEPISTQAMVNAISPFAFSTVKKKKQTSFALASAPPQSPPSPTTKFPVGSASVPASPSSSPLASHNHFMPPPVPFSRSHSKPSSSAVSLPSFSIAPNGTLSEIYQQDGQQAVDPESWQLDDAIEEAQKFLGTWDVEAEARKLAQTSNSANSSDITKPRHKWGVSSSGVLGR